METNLNKKRELFVTDHNNDSNSPQTVLLPGCCRWDEKISFLFLLDNNVIRGVITVHSRCY